MSQTNVYPDVKELSTLLQCLEFSIKSLETSESSVSQDGATRTVDINCQTSGLRVVMETSNATCSCPMTISQKQNSGSSELPGVTGEKQYTKKCDSGLLGCPPNAHREQLTNQTNNCVKLYNQLGIEKQNNKEGMKNKLATTKHLKSPEKRRIQLVSSSALGDLISVEKAAEAMKNKIPDVIKECIEDDKYGFSISDVSTSKDTESSKFQS